MKKLFVCLFLIVFLFSVQGVFAQKTEISETDRETINKLENFIQVYKLTFASMFRYYRSLTEEELEQFKKIFTLAIEEMLLSFDFNSRYFSIEQVEQLRQENIKGVGIVISVPEEETKRRNEEYNLLLKKYIPKLLELDSSGKKLTSEARAHDWFISNRIVPWLVQKDPNFKRVFEKIENLVVPDRGIYIVKVLEGYGAQKAGIKKDGFILEVDGKSVVGQGLNEVVKQIKGLIDTQVKLKIKYGEKEPVDYMVTRGLISVEKIEYQIVGKNKDTAYLKISAFQEKTDKEFEQAVLALQPGVNKWIFDIRRNPGGFLSSVLSILDRILQSGQAKIYESNERYAPFKIERTHKVISEEEKDFLGVVVIKKTDTMAVLIDGDSASATEILASAMQDNQRAIIMGRTTFGKGSIQRMETLPDGSAVKITVAHYFSPVLKKKIDGVGVLPDIEGEDDISTLDKDELLESAIEYLESLDEYLKQNNIKR